MNFAQSDNSDAVVQCAVDGPIAVVTINRPRARNAVNEAVAAGMAACFDELDERKDVQVIVLTGAGGTFCAGMDLKGFLAGEDPTSGGRGFAGIVERPPASRSSPPSKATRWPAGSRWRCPAIDRGQRGRQLRPAGSDPWLGRPAGGLLRLPRRIPYHLAMVIAFTGKGLPPTGCTRPG